MSFFKRKPKPDVMGFICYETSHQRMQEIASLIGDSHLDVEVYAFSTGVIQNVLNVQYTQEIIESTMNFCDKFMFKKYKQYRNQKERIAHIRQQIQQVDLKEEQQIFDLVQKTCDIWQVEKKELHEMLSTWCSTQLLISSDIKSK